MAHVLAAALGDVPLHLGVAQGRGRLQGDAVFVGQGEDRLRRRQVGREGLVDVLQPDVAWAGGITECLRILEMAKAADVPAILHNTYEQPWAVALAGTRQEDPIIEFVDRGPRSQIYSLMGPALHQDSGRVEVPISTDGNTPLPEIISQFSNARK